MMVGEGVGGVGYIGTRWWAATRRPPVLHDSFARSFISRSRPVFSVEPWKINSGGRSERVGGRGPGGCLVGASGSPGRVALVMAASEPVWGLRQRQALPEVFQLCLEFLPFYCQLLPLGHQLLGRQSPLRGESISPKHWCAVRSSNPSLSPPLEFPLYPGGGRAPVGVSVCVSYPHTVGQLLGGQAEVVVLSF